MYIYIFLEIICLEPKLSSAFSLIFCIIIDWDIWIHAKLYTIITISVFTTFGANDDVF